jgi:hypothetical protein
MWFLFIFLGFLFGSFRNDTAEQKDKTDKLVGRSPPIPVVHRCPRQSTHIQTTPEQQH